MAPKYGRPTAPVPEAWPSGPAYQVEAAKRNLQQMITEALALLPNVPPEVRVAVLGQVDAVRLSYFLASILNLGV